MFGDNGRGKVRGLGAIQVSDRFTLREVVLVSNLGLICSLFCNFLMRGLKFASRRVVLEFWIPKETWFAGSFLVTEFSWLTFLEWLVLLPICGSGIGDLDI